MSPLAEMILLDNYNCDDDDEMLWAPLAGYSPRRHHNKYLHMSDPKSPA